MMMRPAKLPAAPSPDKLWSEVREARDRPRFECTDCVAVSPIRPLGFGAAGGLRTNHTSSRGHQCCQAQGTVPPCTVVRTRITTATMSCCTDDGAHNSQALEDSETSSSAC